ncbi:MAG TPA: outer membrane lipoprotein carrier protein LolA [Stellaceae bacterium]|nr:outer membrane lipoprotein carrier protein LolA [Stellaceae bacterium]
MRLNRRAARLAATLCVVLWAAPFAAAAEPASASAVPWDLMQLMRSLRQVRSASGQFTERKTVHMLNAPLVSSGTLSYVAPDRVQKVTLSPTPERFVLDGDQVTIAGGPDQQTHTFALTDYPQIGGLVEGIRATLAGDLQTLDRYYDLQLTGDAANWQLLLQPKDTDLTRFVKWIRIIGTQNRIRAVETEESDGDRSEMSITEDARDAR